MKKRIKITENQAQRIQNVLHEEYKAPTNKEELIKELQQDSSKKFFKVYWGEDEVAAAKAKLNEYINTNEGGTTSDSAVYGYIFTNNNEAESGSTYKRIYLQYNNRYYYGVIEN
jgi:hypothetical protein